MYDLYGLNGELKTRICFPSKRKIFVYVYQNWAKHHVKEMYWHHNCNEFATLLRWVKS